MQISISTKDAAWVEGDVRVVEGPVDVVARATVTQDFKGFGACFNELSWIALQKTDAAARAADP
ncbi:hypothetical protein [Rhizobium sp. C4]|uniref:hypothetical protein n=1 Tax=Rhizobium sp. C4 TaxID=1349800 RepID=UPI001E5AABC2|nr:hypothetical protein [Rhizobium sp. C4]MCD2173373.1 hypothetical protein [Rhizobium sp. C4]